ncbi:MAG TPA: NADH-quinone oxidoreductase subunit J [Nocardioidaceae bacterium]|nr:NADH-quinone oxidoreductase subunit J [Nocardioidaceae bacterium]
MIAFWILAPIMVAAAVGMVLVRKAVHSALLLAIVMISLAILYAVLEAPFLFAVQIIVYTGAVLMLFLFVLMLVGVDASDSLVETIRGQRVLAFVAAVLLGVILVLGAAQAIVGPPEGLTAANLEGNVPGLASLLFSSYVLAFEVTSALLITAVLGAMVLAHQERLSPKPTQRDLALQRVRDYADSGKHPGPLPSPGVFARHNANDTPALLPDGSVADSSVSRVLQARGTVREAPRIRRTPGLPDDGSESAPTTGNDATTSGEGKP